MRQWLPEMKGLQWMDTHCHLDAPEFSEPNRTLAPEMRAQAAIKGVAHCVIPAVEVANFDVVRKLAHALGDSYCLGIHPLYVPAAGPDDLRLLEAQLAEHKDDPRLVAVGEIGLDFFVPELCTPEMREKQEYFYREQLVLARQFGLPVVLHVRRSADRILKYLREVGGGPGKGARPWGGIAHAFNGSEVQAQTFIDLGFKLGFGGAVTFDRATQLRHLAQTLPLDSLVLETDAPDIPPHWLYTSTQDRAAGQAQGINTPAELPRIAEVVATLRGISLAELALATSLNAQHALPKLKALLV
jgi:TatD DNase family protein